VPFHVRKKPGGEEAEQEIGGDPEQPDRQDAGDDPVGG
jgi:hypothetical protein